jgi:toluene monooxygenase system protein E
MTGLYVGQMAPSSFITNAAHFGAADEMRRVQRIAYWTKVLANAHGDELATTELARGAWENDPAWQPLRRACEQLLVTHDWGEAFAARNLAVKPVLDALLNTQFAALAKRNDDEFLALLFAEFGVDSRRSQDWSSALVRYALERRPELREVLTGWLGTWQPRALEAAESLAAAFASPPAAMASSEVTSAVGEQHHAYLELCGL